MAKGAADVAEDLQADAGLLVHQRVELGGGDTDEGGIAIGDDGSGAFDIFEEGNFADEGAFLQSGDGVAVDGGDADFSVEDDEDVVGFFLLIDDGLHIGRVEKFADRCDGGDLVVGESVGHVAVFDSGNEIHGEGGSLLDWADRLRI